MGYEKKYSLVYFLFTMKKDHMTDLDISQSENKLIADLRLIITGSGSGLNNSFTQNGCQSVK